MIEGDRLMFMGNLFHSLVRQLQNIGLQTFLGELLVQPVEGVFQIEGLLQGSNNELTP
jgi:hypothetical protein